MLKPTFDAGQFKQLVRRLIKGGNQAKLTPRETELKRLCEAFGTDKAVLFDAEFYRSQNPDIARAGIDPFWHFLRTGWREGRSPSADFDVSYYLTTHLDVQSQGINPLIHYVETGFAEGRSIRGITDEKLNDALNAAFDRDYYLQTYPDVAGSGQEPLQHYLESGWRENRNPSAQFSTVYYLNTYEDVREAGLDPLTHYITVGQKLGYATQRPDMENGVAGAPADLDPEQDTDDDLDLDNLPLNITGPGALNDAVLVVSSMDNGVIRGVAYNPAAEVTGIEIMVGDKQVASATCNEPRRLAGRLGLPWGTGFTATIPLSARYLNPNATSIRLSAQPATTHRLDWRGRVHPRALFIANASDRTDGSRIYRADLAARQLRDSGVEARVIGQEDAFEQVADGKLCPDEFDVVIFQRVPVISSSMNIFDRMKRKNRRVLYDVDDLMFKPWRRAEMGVIRSGQVKFDDASYAGGLRKRLQMLSLCDGVICSTPFLQRELNSLGMPVILSRNAVDDANFTHGARRLANAANEGFKLMFMSGTPTHDADFAHIQDAVRDVLIANPKVTLTILGELRNRSLDGLPNVIRSPAVSRNRMFEMVAEQDLVLVPLERTAFNTAKSSLKFMECGAAGVPIIASNLFEFERDIRRSGAGMLANTPEQWRMAIQRFIDNPGLSREHGLRAFRYCLDHYSIGSRKDYLWNEICRFDDYLSQQVAVTDRVNQKFSQK